MNKSREQNLLKMKPFEVKAKNLLIVPDVHLDINWVKTILSKEQGNYDHIIWLSDFFDSFKSYPEVETSKNTAKFIIDIIEGRFGPSSLLFSNHDICYYEAHKYSSVFQSPKHLYNMCSGFTKSKSVEISKVLKLEHWQQFHLFYICNGYFISHAGLAQKFWNYYISKEENYDRLWNQCEESLKLINFCSHEILEPGFARGGKQTVGGLTWLDFSDEFIDDEQLPPQICGHTSEYNLIRKKGRSWCLDAMQTAYAILYDDGNLELKSVLPSFNVVDWTNVDSGIVKSWKY